MGGVDDTKDTEIDSDQEIESTVSYNSGSDDPQKQQQNDNDDDNVSNNDTSTMLSEKIYIHDDDLNDDDLNDDDQSDELNVNDNNKYTESFIMKPRSPQTTKRTKSLEKRRVRRSAANLTCRCSNDE